MFFFCSHSHLKSNISRRDMHQQISSPRNQSTIDFFVKQLDENENLFEDFDFVKQLVEFLVQSENLLQIDQRIFVVLRESYANLFQRWRCGEKLSETMNFVFETISNLFLKLSGQISEKNVSLFKEIFFDESILNEINRFLDDFSSNDKYFEDQQMKNVENFFRSIQRLQRICSNNKQNSLFENIVKCICSKTFLDAFSQSINQENENYGQRFLLNTCTDYIYSHSIDQQHKQSLIQIQKSIISTFARWIHENSSSFRLWNSRTLILIRQLSFLLTLSIQLNRQIPIEKESFECFCQLIDSFVNILYSIVHSDGNEFNKYSSSLIGTIIPNLYSMTLASQLEKYLQTKHLTLLFLKLITIENDEIQLNTLKILCSITTEQEAKDILYSNQIAKTLLTIVRKLIDDTNQTLRFSNLIRCVKRRSIKFRLLIDHRIDVLSCLDFIQFDQIKNEFVKENGLDLIIRCATETRFQPIQVQQPALEILLLLSFNPQAFQQTKNQIQQLKICLSSSHHTVVKFARMILWKLEDEEQLVKKERIENENSKYDLIFSSSSSDIEFCRRICEEFKHENYRFSNEQIENIDEKCQLIDSSKYLLVCISDSYRQDLFCRCELTYAFARRCQIIPLILIANYRPDGWLNRMITAKISIDFTKLQFDVALRKLKSEIDRHRKLTFASNPIETHVQMLSNIETSNHFANEIVQWTNDDVKTFVLENNFNALLPLFNQMNGQLLFELYQMCINNRESMFHTLKTELGNLNPSTQPLTLLIYLRFLNEMQKYIPTFLIDQK